MPSAKHLFEFIAVRTFYLFFELLPLRAASALGGWLGQTIGPWLPPTRTARRNLLRVMPERAGEHTRIIHHMWNHFGRLFAEYPHLKTIAGGKGGSHVEMVGLENLNAFRAMGRGGLLVGGHVGNWEFGSAMLNQSEWPLHAVYRAPNNPLVDRLLASARSGVASSIPKGTKGARDIIRALQKKEFVVMLADQKMNDGIEVPFMGIPAMTAAAPAQLAIKFQVPICMMRCERIKGIHFRWTILPPFIPAPDAYVANVMAEINNQIGAWVRERPEQWLWVHRRWGA